MVGANGSARWTDGLLDRMRELGDPVADAPVAAVLERGGVDAVNTDARRRVVETGQFLMDVLAVGGLDEGGKAGAPSSASA